MFRWNPLDHANEYRATAKRHREKGGGRVGPTFTTTRALVAFRGGDPVEGSWDRLAMQVKADWRFARDEALEAFRFAVYPERYELIEL